MAHIFELSVNLTTLVFISLIVSACSGSSDSSKNEQGNSEAADSTIVQSESIATNATATAESPSGENIDSSQLETDPPANVSDSSIIVSTRVTFDITVPVYVSDALQVRLVWGELDTLANWVSDESWTISEDLPTNTLNPLVITFSDANGAIPLGSFEINYRTQTSPSETVEIAASQFDTDRWDADGDGASNLAESISGTNPLGDDMPAPVLVSLELVPDKTFRFSWERSSGAQSYRVLENADAVSGFSNVSGDLNTNTLRYDHRVALLRRMNATYIVQACNAQGCADSDEVVVPESIAQAVGYFKASDAEADGYFGSVVALSPDGNTLAVRNSGSTDPRNYVSEGVYVFARENGTWQQQVILDANPAVSNSYGKSLSLSANGDLLAVGSPEHFTIGDSLRRGAVFLYRRTSGNWEEEARLDSSNVELTIDFGTSVKLDADGNTLAVKEFGMVHIFEFINDGWIQCSRLTVGGGDSTELDLSEDGNILAVGTGSAVGGSVLVFTHSDSGWDQQASIIANDPVEGANFGHSVSLDADGDMLAVGAPYWNFGGGEDSPPVGSAYVFRNIAGNWQQEAQFNTTFFGDITGDDVDISGDGATLVVSSEGWGFVSVYKNDSTNWSLEHRFDSSITQVEDASGTMLDSNERPISEAFSIFRRSASLSSDGDTLAIGAESDDSGSREINGDRFDESRTNSGAVFLF